jgi:hypothetical protein
MSDFGQRQRQRHGVTKKLVEGIGGLIVGAAAVLLLRQWLGPATAGPNRAKAQAQTPALASAGGTEPPAPADAAEPAPKANRSTKSKTSQEPNS